MSELRQAFIGRVLPALWRANEPIYESVAPAFYSRFGGVGVFVDGIEVGEKYLGTAYKAGPLNR